MIKLLLVAAAATIAAPAIANDAHGIDFIRDGHHFVGTVQDSPRGQHLDGRDTTSGETFSLIIANGKVSGTYDGQEVDFVASEFAETASR